MFFTFGSSNNHFAALDDIEANFLRALNAPREDQFEQIISFYQEIVKAIPQSTEMKKEFVDKLQIILLNTCERLKAIDYVDLFWKLCDRNEIINNSDILAINMKSYKQLTDKMQPEIRKEQEYIQMVKHGKSLVCLIITIV
jgi:thiaminase